MLAPIAARAAEIGDQVTAAAARGLERGVLRSLPASALSALWSRAARLERPVALPRGARVIGIGGPTLGGSFKTPLTLSIAMALAKQGTRVSVAAHGFGARVAEPVRVQPHSHAREVGDEALWLARELSPLRVPVFTGRSRMAVLARAANQSEVIIADSLLQTGPERLALSILAVDAQAPWGAGECPPIGDLRARPECLLAVTDFVVAVAGERGPSALPDVRGRPMALATSMLRGARATTGMVVSMADLARMRVGVVVAIARPVRVLHALEAHGITPVVVYTFRDHQVPREPMRAVPEVDVWLTTGKCSTKLGTSYAGAPVFALEHWVETPNSVLREITRRF